MLMFTSLAASLAAASAYSYSTGFTAPVATTFGSTGYGFGSGYSKALPATFSTGFTSPVATTFGTTGGYTAGLLGGFGSMTRGYNTGYAGGYSLGSAAVAPLAVQTSHNVQFADVPSGGSINPISVDVDAAPVPMNMLFKSASSQLNVQQAHQGAAGSVQESQSEDEPHFLKHSVTKPVIQEVREIITPFRKIHQEVQPVQEEINTVVARGTYNKHAFAAPVATHTNFVNTVAAPVATTTFGTTGFGSTGFGSTGFGSTGYVKALPTTFGTTGSYSTGFAAPVATTFGSGYGFGSTGFGSTGFKKVATFGSTGY